MESQSEQHRHRAKEEAQRLTGPDHRQSRGDKTIRFGARRAEFLQFEHLRLHQIGRQPGQRQRDDGRFRRHLRRNHFDHKHLGPEKREHGQVHVQAHPAHDDVGIKVGVGSRQNQCQSKELAPPDDNRRRAEVPVLVERLEDRLVKPIARDLRAQHQQQPRCQKHFARLKERHPEPPPREWAFHRRERPLDVDRNQPQTTSKAAGEAISQNFPASASINRPVMAMPPVNT